MKFLSGEKTLLRTESNSVTMSIFDHRGEMGKISKL